jgi:hypothetical protein
MAGLERVAVVFPVAFDRAKPNFSLTAVQFASAAKRLLVTGLVPGARFTVTATASTIGINATTNTSETGVFTADAGGVLDWRR